jgi:hypothetical protein
MLMAETYSQEWTAKFISTPRGNIYAPGARPRGMPINYTQVLAGAANDTILLNQLPPHSTVSMWESWVRWTGATATATLSLGWQAYRDEDGLVVAANPAGLLSGVLLTAAGGWNGGMLVVATPDDSLPVVDELVLNNRGPVTIVATIGVAAPGVGMTLKGRLHFYTP